MVGNVQIDAPQQTEHKRRVLILCGGASPEHKISLLSARNVFNAIDLSLFEPALVGIRPDGTWVYCESGLINDACTEESVALNPEARPVTLLPDGRLLALSNNQILPKKLADVVFPVLHGPKCEDGTVQGYLQTLGLPFVGSDHYGCAQTMDKAVTKVLLKEAGLPVVDWVVVRSATPREQRPTYPELVQRLGSTLFVKPARMGSSVGVTKVSNANDFNKALDLALTYDTKALVEQHWAGIDVECAVLGPSDRPSASCLGAILPNDDFYSYAAKYQSTGAGLEIPASLSPELTQTLQVAACRAFSVTGCDMLARVDFLVSSTGEWVINEINALPGFTQISMFPKLWEHSAIAYTALVTQLITMGLNRQ